MNLSRILNGRGRSIALVALTAAVTAPVAAFASHNFPDVPASHQFHSQISAIAEAGITKGYGDGTYRPTNAVDRQSMAAFMERGFGRGATDWGTVTADGVSDQLAAMLQVDAGATGSGTGFVLVNASWAGATTNVSACPCEIYAYLYAPASATHPEIYSFTTYDDLAGAATSTGYANGGGALSLALPVGADETRQVELWVGVADPDVLGVDFVAELTGVYVPFGPDGDDSLTYGDATVSASGVEGGSAPTRFNRGDR